jgi:phage FluMu protein Com
MKEYRCPKCKKLLFEYNEDVFLEIVREFGESVSDERVFIEIKCKNCGEDCSFQFIEA